MQKYLILRDVAKDLENTMEIGDVVFYHIHCFHYCFQMGSDTGNTLYAQTLCSAEMGRKKNEVGKGLGSP